MRKVESNRTAIIIMVAGLALIIIISSIIGSLLGRAIGNAHYEREIATVDITGDEPIVQTAVEQIGNKGGKKFWSWYGFNNYAAWCACFVSWCANENGLLQDGTVPKFALTSDGENYFKKHNRWRKGSKVPEPGEIIFFDWEKDGYCNHVGIVTGIADEKVFTIEGNSSDRCRRKVYAIGSPVIMGYGKLK